MYLQVLEPNNAIEDESSFGEHYTEYYSTRNRLCCPYNTEPFLIDGSK